MKINNYMNINYANFKAAQIKQKTQLNPTKKNIHSQKNNTITQFPNHNFLYKNKKLNINFCAKHSNEKKLFATFNTQYKQIYGDIPLEDIIAKNFNKLNLLNSGTDKRVYFFPKMEDCLIAHLYRAPQENIFSQMQKCEVEFSEYNFGQSLFSNGVFTIMKRVPGVPNSTDNYYSVIQSVSNGHGVNVQMAEEYLSKLELFKDFPQAAYDDFAKQIKYLVNQGQFIDFANPNNLLIDKEAEKFHLIDLLSGRGQEIPQEISKELGGVMSGVFEMISLLLDLKFQCYFMDAMSFEQKTRTKEISKQIIEKSLQAAKKEGLANDLELIKARLNFCANDSVKIGFPNRFEECLNLYNSLFENI